MASIYLLQLIPMWILSTIPWWEIALDPEIVLLSADSVDNEQDARSFSVKYFNKLNPTGIHSHCIILKSGVPLMMLRNIDPCSGLMNGIRTTFFFVSANGRVMYCRINDENFQTQVTVAIPWISLMPIENEYIFDRSQDLFPVTVGFTTTISKAQSSNR